MMGQVASANCRDKTPFESVRSRLKQVETSMQCGLFLMTPEIAKIILESLNFADNRHIKHSKIKMMVDDMTVGFWEVTHQGIAFDEDGWLVDGQNRLHAVVTSGKSVPMVVFFNVPRKGICALDTGTSRSVQDASVISGNRDVTQDHVAICRRMILSFTFHAPMSNRKLMELTEEHMEAIDFTIASFGGKQAKVTNAPVMGAVARAWYTQDRARLVAFCQQLKSGMPDNPAEDQASIALRNFLVQEGRKGRFGQFDAVMVYRKTERAIIAFMNKEKLTRVYEAAEELFPLPGDRPAATGKQ